MINPVRIARKEAKNNSRARVSLGWEPEKLLIRTKAVVKTSQTAFATVDNTLLYES